VLLYDADKIGDAASVEREQDCTSRSWTCSSIPTIPLCRPKRLAQGIRKAGSTQRSTQPVYKMAVEMESGVPAASGVRTLPMVWYIPPLSPIQFGSGRGNI